MAQTGAQTGSTPRSFQEIILRLQAYWAAQGLRHDAAL